MQHRGTKNTYDAERGFSKAIACFQIGLMFFTVTPGTNTCRISRGCRPCCFFCVFYILYTDEKEPVQAESSLLKIQHSRETFRVGHVAAAFTVQWSTKSLLPGKSNHCVL